MTYGVWLILVVVINSLINPTATVLTNWIWPTNKNGFLEIFVALVLTGLLVSLIFLIFHNYEIRWMIGVAVLVMAMPMVFVPLAIYFLYSRKLYEIMWALIVMSMTALMLLAMISIELIIHPPSEE